MSTQNPPNSNKDPSRSSPSCSGRRTGRAATTTDACAACRHQRKGCTPECQLKDFFPSSRSKEFQNVRRFFGVKNLTNLIRSVDTPLRQTAVNSMIYEANVRAADCVGGCYRKINYLTNEYAKCAHELDYYRKLIAHYEQNPNFKIVQNPKFENVQGNDNVNDLNVGVQNYVNEIRNLDAELAIGVTNGNSSSLKNVDDETRLSGSGSGSTSGGGVHLRNASAESQLMSESVNTLKENGVFEPIQTPRRE